jgi:hypothetical protein
MFASSSPNDPVTAVCAGPAGATTALALPRPESASGCSTDRRFRATSPAAAAYQAPYDVQRRFVERLSDHGLVRSVSKLAARYRRACDYEICAELRDSVRIQRYLFADFRRVGRLIDGAHREKAAVGLVADFVKGSRSYRDLRRRILSRSPYLLLSYVRDCLSSKPLRGEPGVTGA